MWKTRSENVHLHVAGERPLIWSYHYPQKSQRFKVFSVALVRQHHLSLSPTCRLLAPRTCKAPKPTTVHSRSTCWTLRFWVWFAVGLTESRVFHAIGFPLLWWCLICRSDLFQQSTSGVSGLVPCTSQLVTPRLVSELVSTTTGISISPGSLES